MSDAVRPFADLLARTTTSAVCDVLVKRGLKSQHMGERVKALGSRIVAGPALTIERRPLTAVKTPLPMARMVEAIEAAAAGTVMVFNDSGEKVALWGGLMAAAAVYRDLGGVVADGPVRDPGEIMELGCPCFCTGTLPAGQAGFLALMSLGEPIECGGVRVSDGDFVFGDGSGVVVIPKGIEDEVLRAAVEVEQGDQSALRMLQQGKSFTETMRALGRV